MSRRVRVRKVYNMPLLPFRQTRVGSYSIDTLEKEARPQVIFSRRERQKMQALHEDVLRWAALNLPKPLKEEFSAAMQDWHYGAAFSVLMREFHANPCVTIRQRRRWEKWLENVSRGFHPA